MVYRPARELVGCDKANTEKNSNMYFSLCSIIFYCVYFSASWSQFLVQHFCPFPIKIVSCICLIHSRRFPCKSRLGNILPLVLLAYKKHNISSNFFRNVDTILVWSKKIEHYIDGSFPGFIPSPRACLHFPRSVFRQHFLPRWCRPTHTFTGAAHSHCPLLTTVLESELEQHNDQGQN